MNKYGLYSLILIIIFPLFACKRVQIKNQEVNNNSYINDFELIQENQNRDRTIIITSPRAIIEPINNDIKIFESSIDVINKIGNDINIKSGKSSLINSSKLIKAFNNVIISILDTENYYIKTDSLNWDLNASNIDLDTSLLINFDNTRISSTSGSYDIKSGILKINNNIFNRSIFNSDGIEQYKIQIISDYGNWFNKNNTLEFKSDNKQVETTIHFLGIQ